jgi:uncharacterized protein YdhG (YjbR/CyaY superfamily)
MTSPEEYIDQVAEDKKEAFIKLRQTIKDHLPKGFKEVISYKMLGYVVPKSIYPDGYHCDTSLPLPFMNLAAQKNFIALYHMGIYANPELMKWFTTEYPKHCKTKLDMGKSCIRFKKVDDIPYELIGQLVEKMTVDDWVGIYEGEIKR